MSPTRALFVMILLQSCSKPSAPAVKSSGASLEETCQVGCLFLNPNLNACDLLRSVPTVVRARAVVTGPREFTLGEARIEGAKVELTDVEMLRGEKLSDPIIFVEGNACGQLTSAGDISLASTTPAVFMVFRRLVAEGEVNVVAAGGFLWETESHKLSGQMIREYSQESLNADLAECPYFAN